MAPPKTPNQLTADQIELRHIDSLTPYEENARTHSPTQVEQIVRSIEQWGWTNPVLLDESGGIIAGHGRVLAAGQLYSAGGSIRTAGGSELPRGHVPCLVARGWTAGQRRAYVLADNQLALNAGWDLNLLKIELTELKSVGFNLETIGFSGSELAGIMAERVGKTDPDETPPVPAEPVTRLGDVWLLGNHRLVCGDSTSVESVDKALNGVKPHLMVTDPPYGVSYDPMWRNRVKRQDGSLVGAKATGIVHNDGQADWSEAWSLFPGDAAYVWNGALHSHEVAASLIVSGFDLRSQIVWNKQQLVIGRGDYHWKHECCWYVVRKGKIGHYDGGRKQSTVWDIDAPSGYRQKKDGADAHTGIHSTQKPVECMKRPIENNSSPGQAVYEPFSGSGTTIIAGEMTGRTVHAIELSPAYVDVAVIRWQNFTGRKAVHAKTGLSFG